MTYFWQNWNIPVHKWCLRWILYTVTRYRGGGVKCSTCRRLQWIWYREAHRSIKEIDSSGCDWTSNSKYGANAASSTHKYSSGSRDSEVILNQTNTERFEGFFWKRSKIAVSGCLFCLSSVDLIYFVSTVKSFCFFCVDIKVRFTWIIFNTWTFRLHHLSSIRSHVLSKYLPNISICSFCLSFRHFYKPLLRRGVSKMVSQSAVFFLSAFFHEVRRETEAASSACGDVPAGKTL